LLASSPDQQLEFFARTACPREELILEWLNWDCMMLPQVIEAGALTDELVQLTQSITEEITALNDRTDTLEGHRRVHSDEALRKWSEWEQIRTLSRSALLLLSGMGVSARSLTDPRYNDAPSDCDEMSSKRSAGDAP
jgi:hypothetical protein